MMRFYIAFLIIGLLFFGCVEEPEVEGNQTELPEIGPENGTELNDTNLSENETYELPANYSVKLGDMVWVDYTLWVDEEAYDTSNATLAMEEGIFNPYRGYEPFTFQVLFDQGVIEGFIINVIGMEINETVMFSVDPERGYGYYDQSMVMIIPRYYNKSLYETVPKSFLESQGLNVSVGEGFETDYGTVFIDSIDGDNVTLFYILTPGSTFTFNNVPQEVVGLDNLTATIEYTFQMNSSYILPHPDTMAATRYVVTNKTDQNITLDANHPLANKTLQFEVTLLDIEPYVG